MATLGNETRHRYRRDVLCGVGAGSIGVLAGCLDLIGGDGTIEPESVGPSLSGTPGEMYTLVERNDISVEEMYRDGDDVTLSYISNATNSEESVNEIGVIVTLFNEVLVKHETDIEMFYGTIEPGFDDQSKGWGVKTGWLEGYNDGEIDETTLWNNILNSRVYGEDL